MIRVIRLSVLLSLLLGLVVAFGPQATVLAFERSATLDDFPVDAVLQVVACDINGDGLDELLLAARNYERRQVFVYALLRDGRGFKTLWQSENLSNESDHIGIAAGRFTDGKMQLAVIGGGRLTVYQWASKGMKRVFEQPFNASVQEVSAGKLPGDEFDSLFLTEVAKVSNKTFSEAVSAWRFDGAKFVRKVVLDPVGNIRSLTYAALDDSGPYLVLDVGRGVTAGEVIVAQWDNGHFTVVSKDALRPAPIFALGAFRGSDSRDLLLLGGDRGKVFLYDLVDGKLKPLEGPVSLGWGLVSVAAGRFRKQGPEAVVVEHPNLLHIINL